MHPTPAAESLDLSVPGPEDHALRARLIGAFEDGDGPSRIRAMICRALHRGPESSRPSALYGPSGNAAQILRFERLRQALPFVRQASSICNGWLLEALSNTTEATVVDIGAGDGGQLAALVGAAVRHTRLRTVHVVALEPDPRSLARAEVRVRAAAQQCGLDLRWTGIERTIEDGLSPLADAVADGPHPLAINAAFCLHHIRPGAPVCRQGVLDALATLRPATLVLAEPHACHATADLEQRVQSASVHYGRVFTAIDGVPGDHSNDRLVDFGHAKAPSLSVVQRSRPRFRVVVSAL